MWSVRIKAFCWTKVIIAHYIFILLLGQSAPLEVKVAEDHGKQKAAFYAGFSVSQQEVTFKKIIDTKREGA